MILRIYSFFLKLKTRRKLKRFKQLAVMDEGVAVGPSSNIFRDAQSRVTIGAHSEVLGIVSAKFGGSVSIGHHTTIRGGAIQCIDSVTIGNDVIISNSVFISDNNNHPISEIERHKMCEGGFYGEAWQNCHSVHAPIVIEDNVWIGQGCSILKGVTIGHGSIIGLNSVVTKPIPPHSIAAGNPARVLKEIPENERL